MGIRLLKAKSTIFLIATLLLLGVFSGCSNKSNNEATTESLKGNIKNITPQDAKKRLDSENEIIVLDVRTKEEYETGHIEKAILMPLDTLVNESQKNLKDKETTIFVYCRSGSRSFKAAEILIDQGYKNVYNLGGIIDWPYEIEM